MWFVGVIGWFWAMTGGWKMLFHFSCVLITDNSVFTFFLFQIIDQIAKLVQHIVLFIVEDSFFGATFVTHPVNCTWLRFEEMCLVYEIPVTEIPKHPQMTTFKENCSVP